MRVKIFMVSFLVIVLFLFVGCSNVFSHTESTDIVNQTPTTIGVWPPSSPLPVDAYEKSTKSNSDILPPKDSWNFTVQTSTYAYYAKSVWKAGTDTIIKGYWSGTANKWEWHDGYSVFELQTYGVVTILPKGSEIYVIHGFSSTYTKQLQTIQEWTGSDSKVLNFTTAKSPLVIDYSYAKTSSIASSFEIGYQIENGGLFTIGSEYSAPIVDNGTILEGTGKYRLIVKSSGCNWRIIIGVEP